MTLTVSYPGTRIEPVTLHNVPQAEVNRHVTLISELADSARMRVKVVVSD